MIDLRLTKGSFTEPYTLRERISIRFDLARYDVWRFREDGFARWVAFHLPRKLALWAFIRVMANAGSDQHPDEMTYGDAYKAWERRT